MTWCFGMIYVKCNGDCNLVVTSAVEVCSGVSSV